MNQQNRAAVTDRRSTQIDATREYVGVMEDAQRSSFADSLRREIDRIEGEIEYLESEKRHQQTLLEIVEETDK